MIDDRKRMLAAVKGSRFEGRLYVDRGCHAVPGAAAVTLRFDLPTHAPEVHGPAVECRIYQTARGSIAELAGVQWTAVFWGHDRSGRPVQLGWVDSTGKTPRALRAFAERCQVPVTYEGRR